MVERPHAQRNARLPESATVSSSGDGGECKLGIVQQFLDTGAVDAVGTNCVSAIEAAGFVLP